MLRFIELDRVNHRHDGLSIVQYGEIVGIPCERAKAKICLVPDVSQLILARVWYTIEASTEPQ